MTTTTAPTYRLAATWGGYVVIDDEANVIHRLHASDHAWAMIEAKEAGYVIRSAGTPAPVDLEPEEIVPTCDHCPRTQEEGDWCGSCGCCTTHCEQATDCAPLEDNDDETARSIERHDLEQSQEV